MPDDYALVLAMSLASSLWSRAFDFVAAVPYYSPVKGTAVGGNGGVAFDACPRQRCLGTRCALPDVRYKLCAERVLPCKRLMPEGVNVADIVGG